jgi:hypothetical protein
MADGVVPAIIWVVLFGGAFLTVGFTFFFGAESLRAQSLMTGVFPRGTDLSRFSQAHLNRIALRLNQRPRKTLGFETPADKLRAVLH